MSASQVDMLNVAQLVLDEAKKLGMDQAETAIHQGTGISVTARLGELETVEKHNDTEVVISVYKNHKTGSASSADASEQGIRQTVQAAVSIANHTGQDDCFGLADKALMATDIPDLDLYHAWDIDITGMCDIALQCEQAARSYDKRIINSEGATVNSYSGADVYANSHGFMHKKRASRHSISCSVISGHEQEMQRDYWYDSNRNANKLESVDEIGVITAKRTIRRLGAKQVKSCQVPVLLEAPIASSLIAHFIAAIKGGALYKKASFLLDKLDQQIFPEFIDIWENPRLQAGSGSSAYDNEGVVTADKRSLIEHGVLQGYVLGSYTARKLKMQSTANAGGVRNVSITHSDNDFDTMLSTMGTGLLVTELIGSGINMVTGDYSRGAAGFWIENGKIQHAVDEVTIAGNLADMFMKIAEIGNDVDYRGNIHSGSILLDNMTIAGA